MNIINSTYDETVGCNLYHDVAESQQSFHESEKKQLDPATCERIKSSHDPGDCLQGCSLLHLACHSGSLVMVELLLQLGADINKCDLHGRTPLQHCILKRNNVMAKFLLRRYILFLVLCVIVMFDSDDATLTASTYVIQRCTGIYKGCWGLYCFRNGYGDRSNNWWRTLYLACGEWVNHQIWICKSISHILLIRLCLSYFLFWLGYWCFVVLYSSLIIRFFLCYLLPQLLYCFDPYNEIETMSNFLRVDGWLVFKNVNPGE